MIFGRFTVVLICSALYGEATMLNVTSMSTLNNANVVNFNILLSFLNEYEKLTMFRSLAVYTDVLYIRNNKGFLRSLMSRWTVHFTFISPEDFVSNRVPTPNLTETRHAPNTLFHFSRCDLLLIILEDSKEILLQILQQWPSSQAALVLVFNPDHLTGLRLPLDNNVLFIEPSGALPPDSSAPWRAKETPGGRLTAPIATEKEQTFRLWQTYVVNERSHALVESFGVWDRSAALSSPVPASLAERRSDLLGVSLSCATQPDFYTINVSYDENMQLQLTGWTPDFIRILEQRLNFTCQWHVPADGQWGVRDPDGVWTGLVGDLVTGGADMIITTLDHSLARAQAVDYLISVSESWTVPHVRAGSRSQSLWTPYTEEFSPEVWAVLCAVAVGAAVALFLILRLSPLERRLWTSRDVSGSVTAVLLAQGCSQLPTSTSGRMALLSLIMLSVLAHAHYSAFLYSKLTSTRVQAPFSSFKEIVDDGSYDVGLVRGSSAHQFLMETKDPVLKRVYDKLVTPRGIFHGWRDLLKKMETDKIIGIMSLQSFEVSIEVEDRCLYVGLPMRLLSVKAGYAVLKKSPLKTVLDNQNK